MKIGRNDPCYCGSGKKYKFCHYAADSAKHETSESEERAEVDGDERADAAAAAEDENAAQEQARHSFEREKGRGRFHGNKRGGSTSFSPRTFRGSQRGS